MSLVEAGVSCVDACWVDVDGDEVDDNSVAYTRGLEIR